jgi:hypothetical protein
LTELHLPKGAFITAPTSLPLLLPPPPLVVLPPPPPPLRAAGERVGEGRHAAVL